MVSLRHCVLVPSDSLSSVTALRQALERIPDGEGAVRMFARLGLWTSEAHRATDARKMFPQKFSDLGPQELSDLSARVVSDAGRVAELVGLLVGLEAKLKMRSRAARATSRSKVRREWPEGEKTPAKNELDDRAEEDPTVIELEEQLGLLTLLLSQAQAIREANQLYKEAVSREISYRSAQMQARLY